ncbi:cytosolic phospholipase A2 gamma-like [Trematomus bernacchii]|uniref:cytosolic phospholipase A2 gamma-like n=1 Tax=Trematomus bernacchii TaxID=40690 RepID=UPI00146D1590|nr:cytosolic phospholipase A2 gamma-like [Trematomus bernacchii]
MMQTGYTGFSVSVISLWLLISFALAKAEQNMEGNTTTSQKSVRHSQFLCSGEQEYVHKRKQVILESLSSLGINCSEDSVPHITLLASGGGQRAAVGLVGSLYQMAKEDMLDTVLYLGGVSGSTWSMATIYSDPQWSTNMDAAVSQLSGPGVELKEALAWLGERAKEEHFSLTDIWGVLTSAGIMKQMDLRCLSDEASRNATNPYPIYSATEMNCFSNGPIEGKWFEVSPHEAGFTELGLFIETSLLGSKFQRGELLEQKPEMDMVKLQGILGCALADEDAIKDYLPPWLNVPGQVDGSAEEYMRVYNALVTLVAMTRSTIKDPTALSDLDKLQTILEETFNDSKSAWLESKSSEERKNLAQQLSLKLLNEVETWSQSLEEGAFKTHVSLLTSQVIPKIMKWEWGTTANFLYQYQDSTVPPCLSTKERIQLVDAGLLINVGYPPFLGDKRDIDLIIAPEYSAGNIFETLIFARDYAAEVNKSFPEIDDKVLEEREWPKDCYVFEGKETELSIVYMPLFNRNNCKDAEEVKARMEEFSTFQRPFSQDKIEFVLETAKTNMENNKDILLREINKAVLRRQNKRKSLLQPTSCTLL